MSDITRQLSSQMSSRFQRSLGAAESLPLWGLMGTVYSMNPAGLGPGGNAFTLLEPQWVRSIITNSGGKKGQDVGRSWSGTPGGAGLILVLEGWGLSGKETHHQSLRCHRH